MKIQNKIGLVFLFSVVFITVFGVYLLNLNNQILEKRKRFSLSYEQVISLMGLKEAFRATIGEVTQIMSFGEDAREYDFHKERVESILIILEENMNNELTFVRKLESEGEEEEEEEEEEDFLKELIIKTQEFLSQTDLLVNNSRIKPAENSQEVFDDLIKSVFEKILIVFIENMIKEEKEELKGIEAQVSSLAREAKVLTLVEIGLISIIFLLILFYLSRVFVQPIVSLEEASHKLEENNFDIQLPFKSNDEIGRLTEAFASMASRIQLNMTELKTYLASIVEHSNDAIIGKDLFGNILSWNKAAEKSFGYREDQVKGKHISLIVPPNKSDEVSEIIEKVNRGILIEGFETQRKTRDGILLDVYLNSSPIKNEFGKVIGVSIITRDITQMKKNQKALLEAKNAAEKANAAKTEFLARMSHELRTPMNAILGFTQLMKMDPDAPLSDRQKENMDRVSSAGSHLLDLINEVLDLSEIESDNMKLAIETVDIVPLVDNVISIFEPISKKKRISLRYNRPLGKNYFVKADSKRFKQVVFNLISNAIKYNKPDGSVNVLFEEMRDATVCLKVEDTGCGIPENKRDKLFQPFERFDRKASSIEGTGIGLTITRQLIELMGGTIGYETVVGEGSCFYIKVNLTEKSSLLKKVKEE